MYLLGGVFPSVVMMRATTRMTESMQIPFRSIAPGSPQASGCSGRASCWKKGAAFP